jgi:hypothetical protein
LFVSEGEEIEGEGDLLVEDRSQDSEQSHRENKEEDNLAASWELRFENHWEWRDDESEVRRDIENHLQDTVVMIRGALQVLDRHSPILIERSAEYTIVEDLDECEANPDVDEEEPHSALILWKLSAAQHLIRSCLLEGGRRTYNRRISKVQMQSFTPQVEAIMHCSRAMTILEPRMRFLTSLGSARMESCCSGGYRLVPKLAETLIKTIRAI